LSLSYRQFMQAIEPSQTATIGRSA